MAIQNHIRKINTNHQININAFEEVIDIAPVVIPRIPIDNEIPYQANPLRRNNELMAIQALLENVRIDIEANARNAGLNIFQARDKLKSDLLLAGTGVVPDTLSASLERLTSKISSRSKLKVRLIEDVKVVRNSIFLIEIICIIINK
jgi:hypothetical protein